MIPAHRVGVYVHLGASVRVLRAPIAAIEEALRRLELDEQEAPERVRPRRSTPAFPHGAPTSDAPPPPSQDEPIPLVRRSPQSPETAAAESSNLTQRPPNYGPMSADAASATYPPLRSPRFAITAPPPVRDDGTSTPPSVRFPSPPPPPRLDPNENAGDRHTPPYGTPILAPPAPPLDLGRRAGASEREGDCGEPLVELSNLFRSPAPSSSFSSAPPPRPGSIPPPGGRRTPRPEIPCGFAEPGRAQGDRRSAASAAGARHRGEGEVEPAAADLRGADGAPVMAALTKARSRDDIIRLGMRGMHLVARRLAVFIVRRDGFHGWACNVEFGDEEALRSIVIPEAQPSVLATATATTMYLGPIPQTPAHEALLAVMERASTDVAAIAVRIAARPTLVLMADELEDSLMGTRFLAELAPAIGDALARLLAPK